MKIQLLLLLIPGLLLAQEYKYDASEEFPYGQLNPEAPSQTADYAPMIGTCDCESTKRNPDGTWTKPVAMIWRFKYILNGYGVQDETLKADGSHSGSIRQFVADSSKWYVHWYSNKTPTTTLSTWEGGKKEDKNVLYKAQKAPNGMDGFTRLTFKDVSKKGFNWVLEWVDKAETIIFPTWKISCLKREE